MTYNYACCGKPAETDGADGFMPCEDHYNQHSTNLDPLTVKDEQGILHDIGELNLENEHDKVGGPDEPDMEVDPTLPSPSN